MLKAEICLLILLPLVAARGPHHPRGEKIVQHHVHYRPTKNSQDNNEGGNIKLIQDTNLLHDTEHIQEDLGDWASNIDLSHMTKEELEFHYFKVHDSDNNTKLDGLEILQAILHTVDHANDVEENYDFEFYVELIDRTLAEDDIDGDGYLSYAEYVAGRQNNEENDEPLQSSYKKLQNIELNS